MPDKKLVQLYAHVKERLLDGDHWVVEKHMQRMKSSEWQELLLSYNDSIIFKGRVTKLITKNLGYGVVEIFKETPND